MSYVFMLILRCIHCESTEVYYSHRYNDNVLLPKCPQGADQGCCSAIHDRSLTVLLKKHFLFILPHKK